MRRYVNPDLEAIDLTFWHDLIESCGSQISLKKGEYLCHKGEATNMFGFVESGYLLYKIQGQQNRTSIVGFVFANALWGNYPDCMKNAPAMFDIVAGSSAEVRVMDATVLPTLYRENLNACRQGMLLMEALFNSVARSYCALYSATPMQRYVDLIQRYPQIQQDVSQKEIAEYLGISPIHLCRLRKELLLKESVRQ